MPTGDLSTLRGKWLNANRHSKGILEIDFRVVDDNLRVSGLYHAKGPASWGEAAADVFTCTEEDNVPSVAALAFQNFGFMDVEFQIRMNKGILAVTTFHHFTDESGRFDYVTRELYRHADA